MSKGISPGGPMGRNPLSLWNRVCSRSSVVFEVTTVVGGVLAIFADLIGLINAERFQTVVIGLLFLLAGSALLERVTKLKRLDDQLAEVHEDVRGGKLAEHLAAMRTQDTDFVRHFEQFGVSWVYEDLSKAAIGEKLERATSIRILCTWTGILNQHGTTLMEAAQRGAKIEILMLQHDSRYAALRSHELGLPDQEAPSKIIGELVTLQSMCLRDAEARQNIEVRAYDGSPVNYMITFDEFRLLGSYWRNRVAASTPLLLLEGAVLDGGLDRRSALVKLVDDHFESVWNDAQTKYVWIPSDGSHAACPTYVSTREQAWLGPADQTAPCLDSVVTPVRA